MSSKSFLTKLSLPWITLKVTIIVAEDMIILSHNNLGRGKNALSQWSKKNKFIKGEIT